MTSEASFRSMVGGLMTSETGLRSSVSRTQVSSLEPHTLSPVGSLMTHEDARRHSLRV